MLIVDVSAEGEAVAARVREAGGRASFLAGDVGLEETWERAARTAEESFVTGTALTVDGGWTATRDSA